MKIKTIKQVIVKKMNKWLATIENDTVRDLVKKNTIVTGGCIVSMLLKEPVNDFDVYFRTKETALAVANYYVDQFKLTKVKEEDYSYDIEVKEDVDRIRIFIRSHGVAYSEDSLASTGEDQDETAELAEPENPEKPPHRPVFLSDNAITLSGGIQMIVRFFGEPEEIHANFDFVHCTNYWTSWDNNLVLSQPALESILVKDLRYVGSKYPVCSLFRIRKFVKRGWTITAGQILKIAMQISALDLTDVAVLEDQLTGVDVTYFLMIIEKLKERDPNKVDVAYLSEIIDRMF